MLKIRIELKSDLCAASGRSAGSVVDNDLSFDSFGLPVIPGRRLKGVLRQAAVFLAENNAQLPDGKEAFTAVDVDALFGSAYDAAGALTVGNAALADAERIRNTIREGSDRSVYPPQSVIKLYTYVKGQTAMKDGVADTGDGRRSGTLRYTRVLRARDPVSGGPIVFYAPVRLGDEGLKSALALCCRAVRHIGLMRSRGLGWVSLSLEETADSPEDQVPASDPCDEAPVTLEYSVLLESGVVLRGCSEQLAAIPGRSVIGCFASKYIKKFAPADPSGDGIFRDLFLNGRSRWSDVTPMINGSRTVPAPLMLIELKNEKRVINRLIDAGSLSGKLKTLEGYFAAIGETRIALARVDTVSTSHISNADSEQKQLYSVTSLAPGLMYCGRVTLPGKYVQLVRSLFTGSDIRFGGSKSAQYAECRLIGVAQTEPKRGSVQLKAGEPVFLLLESDMLPVSCGTAVLDNSGLRELLAGAFGGALTPAVPTDGNGKPYKDFTAYHTVGGFNSAWRLSKPQRTVVSGGSVFCLTAAADTCIDREKLIGECRQEGMGAVRALTRADMERIEEIGLCLPQHGECGDQFSEAFKNAFARMEKNESIPREAYRLYAGIRNSGRLGGLVNSRIRLMTDEARNWDDLRLRVSSIRRQQARSSAEFLLDSVEAKKSDYNWKELMLAVLHLHYYDTESKKEGGK